ncbi:MAG: aminotransferase class V-fold PLP-dependent enzyme [Gemmatimonadota bacterium]|nr:aminotransferase class V-fold PLP-dependent enzyme [Gemmatimonadota bacterium]
MSPDEFRALGHHLVDRIGEFLAGLPDRPVTPGESPATVRAALGGGGLPTHGGSADSLLEEAASLLFDHSLFNSHPRFWGYITSSPAPIGILGDLLAAAVNQNVGGWPLAPMATEIEAQTIRWIAELLGYPTSCGGLLVSGGNMANFVGFLAARKAKAGWDVRTSGMAANPGGLLRAYASAETHTWLQKAADLFGLGTDAVRWIPTDACLRMDAAALRRAIQADEAAGDRPFLVVGTAGSVSTGAVDPLPELAAICREHGLWFHVDGAYGGFAVAVPDAPPDLLGLREADSVAVDPHKWLYAPLEAGCALVRDPRALLDAFSYRPPYYHLDPSDEAPINFYEYGPQNSRGFRGLKVWLGLRHAGREGYTDMIGADIALARSLHQHVAMCPGLEPRTQELSITTFRYVPPDLEPGGEAVEAYLNLVNAELLTRLQAGGEVYVSNAVVGGAFLLRACVVNFRTSAADVAALPGVVVRIGAAVDAELRPRELTRAGK